MGVGVRACVREVAHTQISSSLLQHPNFTSSLMEITQSSIPNQANIFWRRTDSRLSLMLNYISGKPGSKPPGKFQFFGVEIFFSSFFRGGLMFYSPLVFFFSSSSPPPVRRLRWWILCCSSSNAEGEAPEIRAMEGGGERRRRCGAGENCQGEMLCRSMKNCTGILPPQLTVWEADLISGESIRLELWEITLLKSPWWLP